jgi:hypothetical protein
VAVIGAGPAGLAAAKHLLDRGFEPVVLERSEQLGGQWSERSPRSAAWTGMRASTSRTMTAFSELAPAPGPMFPSAAEVQRYLHAYATRFGVAQRIVCGARVVALARGGTRCRLEWVDSGGRRESEVFAAVAVASGRFSRPRFPLLPGLAGFAGRGRVLHSSAYRTRDELRGLRVLVHGNGVSGLEIASDLAAEDSIAVVSSCARPRYVLPKVLRGVPAETLWSAHLAALRRHGLAPEREAAELRRMARELGGDPAAFGALAPDPDILAAGVTHCQSYLPLVADGRIRVKPAIGRIEGDTVRFADGSTGHFDAIVCAGGYEHDLPYLAAQTRTAIAAGSERLALYEHTVHPDLPALGFVGLLLLQGPYLPVLELQARLLAGLWSGEIPAPGAERMRAGVGRSRRPLLRRPHAAELARELATAADLAEPSSSRSNQTQAKETRWKPQP